MIQEGGRRQGLRVQTVANPLGGRWGVGGEVEEERGGGGGGGYYPG